MNLEMYTNDEMLDAFIDPLAIIGIARRNASAKVHFVLTGGSIQPTAFESVHAAMEWRADALRQTGVIVGTLNAAPDAKTVEQHRELEALTRDYEVQHKALIDVSRELNLALEERRVRIAELDKIKAEHRNAQECVDQMTTTVETMTETYGMLEDRFRKLEEENKMLRSANESFQQDREELRMLRNECNALREANNKNTELMAKVRNLIAWNS